MTAAWSVPFLDYLPGTFYLAIEFGDDCDLFCHLGR